jgi:hypothetical protein
VLAHLSEINNHPDLVRSEVRQYLQGNETLTVALAEQGIPGKLAVISEEGAGI